MAVINSPFDHTFNIVTGCFPVSPGCDHCIARIAAGKADRAYLWARDGKRQQYSEDYWKQPIFWNRYAQRASRPIRVLASDRCDVFEDHPTVNQERAHLWDIIRETPHLEWWILTKRSQELERAEIPNLPNIHIGVSVESQGYMYRVQPMVDWLAVEPMLGPVDISDIAAQLCWVMVGGEIGPDARAAALIHFDKLLQQCKYFGVPFYLKQTGRILAKQLGLPNEDGFDSREWPDWLRIRQSPLVNLSREKVLYDGQS